MEVKERIIRVLELAHEACPFEDWVDELDKATQARIKRRVGRLRLGNFGDWKNIGDGVVELRLEFGPGYRVYLAEHGSEIVVLLGGGSKRTQEKDIEEAKILWRKFKDEDKRFQRELT